MCARAAFVQIPPGRYDVDRADRIRSDQIRSDQIRSDQIRLGQIRSDKSEIPGISAAKYLLINHETAELRVGATKLTNYLLSQTNG